MRSELHSEKWIPSTDEIKHIYKRTHQGSALRSWWYPLAQTSENPAGYQSCRPHLKPSSEDMRFIPFPTQAAVGSFFFMPQWGFLPAIPFIGLELDLRKHYKVSAPGFNRVCSPSLGRCLPESELRVRLRLPLSSFWPNDPRDDFKAICFVAVLW
jgi:hypothetical protein